MGRNHEYTEGSEFLLLRSAPSGRRRRLLGAGRTPLDSRIPERVSMETNGRDPPPGSSRDQPPATVSVATPANAGRQAGLETRIHSDPSVTLPRAAAVRQLAGGAVDDRRCGGLNHPDRAALTDTRPRTTSR
ncbi:hypothetical protein ALC62_01244 [Cyphomyrmex costatus]|uniref:Uncharacterized protein n=1 Tax=Cyphomyrmex costatus TaxID=456900 RepID=A0A195D4B9_9HYME|nr:hypothetical protein ALC62_01244 [Cyphomyrmex costatus]